MQYLFRPKLTLTKGDGDVDLPRAATCDIAQLLRQQNGMDTTFLGVKKNSDSRPGVATEMQSETSTGDRSQATLSKARTLTFKRDKGQPFQTLVPMVYERNDDAQSFLVKNQKNKRSLISK